MSEELKGSVYNIQEESVQEEPVKESKSWLNTVVKHIPCTLGVSTVLAVAGGIYYYRTK